MTVPLDVVRLRAEFRSPHELVETSDGRMLFLRRWVGSGGTDPVLLLLHGITAYSEPYGPLMAEELAGAGYHVFGLDLRGHGRSDGVRGDLPSGDRLAQDLGETLDHLRSRFPRIVVLGHSLGVITTMIAFNHYPRSIDGLILLSGGRRVRPGVYRPPTATEAVKTLLGIALFRSRPLIGYRREGMLGLDDPLFNFRYSARFYTAVYGLSPWAVVRMLRQNIIDSPNLTPSGTIEIPVLVGVGDQDELFTVESSRALFDGLQANRKEFFVVPGGHHASFPRGSWVPVVDWLKRQFPVTIGQTPTTP